MSHDKPQCSATVYPKETWGAFHGYRCRKPPKVERNGKLYCAVHDPEAVKERDKAQRAKWDAESKQKQDAWEREQIMRKLCSGIPTKELANYELVRKRPVTPAET